MNFLLLLSLFFGTAFSQGGQNGGGEGGSSGQDCGSSTDLYDCTSDGGNGSCVWQVFSGDDCGTCGDTQGMKCTEFVSYVTDELSDLSYYCTSNGVTYDEYCSEPTKDPDTGGEGTTGGTGGGPNQYNCTDYDDCETYAEWAGTIKATTSTYNLRWLCYGGCDWDNIFRILFPDGVVTVSVDCSDETSTDTDTETFTDTTTIGGEDDTRTDTGGGEGGSGGSGGESGTPVRRRRLMQQGGGESGSGGEGGNTGTNTNGGGDGTDGEYEGDGTEWTVYLTVDAKFYSCNAYAGISDTFSDLASRIEDEQSGIDVFVQCSDLDCCESDSWCTSAYFCDTDGDSNYDSQTYDGETVDPDGPGGANESSANKRNVLLAFVFAAIVAILY